MILDKLSQAAAANQQYEAHLQMFLRALQMRDFAVADQHRFLALTAIEINLDRLVEAHRELERPN